MSDQLADLKQQISSGLESPEEWQSALEKILGIMECTTGTIHILGAESNMLELRAHKGIPDELMPMVKAIPIGKGIAGAAAERREPIQMCNLQTDTSGTARPDAKKTNVAGNVAVPIIDGDGELRGTLGVGKYVPHDFIDDETALLSEIASML